MRIKRGFSSVTTVLVVGFIIISGAIGLYLFSVKPASNEIATNGDAITEPVNANSVPTPNFEDTNEDDLPALDKSVSKTEVLSILGTLAPWTIIEASQPDTWYCDSAYINPSTLSVISMRFGPGSPDTNPGIRTVMDQIKKTLESNDWDKCSEYVGPDGTETAITYIKNGFRILIKPRFSMATGNFLSVNFEYGNLGEEAKTTRWYPYRIPPYSYMIPASWTAITNPNGTISFNDLGTGKLVAGLTCPIPEGGYEAWELSEISSKTIRVPGDNTTSYRVSLQFGTPRVENLDLDIIFMSQNEPPQFLANSCKLESYDSSQRDLMREIYNSVMVL